MYIFKNQQLRVSLIIFKNLQLDCILHYEIHTRERLKTKLYDERDDFNFQ